MDLCRAASRRLKAGAAWRAKCAARAVRLSTGGAAEAAESRAGLGATTGVAGELELAVASPTGAPGPSMGGEVSACVRLTPGATAPLSTSAADGGVCA